ncbi:MAG: methyltransferase [Verrucomicrobia bacterium]|nr:methyltransferase [Verrucomicrobiota bacterium]
MPSPGQLQEPTDHSSADALLQMITGFWTSQAVLVAAKLGIADLLKDGPKPCAELARSAGVRPQALYRLLRALASVGVFREEEEGCFGLTPLGARLQTGVPGSLRAFTLFQEYQYRAWEAVLHSLRTEETTFDKVQGQPLFPYLAAHPAVAAVFNEGMTNLTAQVAAAVVAAYDFAQFGTLVDVGGGAGILLTRILKANPALRGVLFDVPHVAENAKSRMAEAGLSDRCAIAAGDFFQAVPPRGDAYLLKWIIHDWDDERAITILKHCHSAMTERGKLLVIEAVLPPGNAPFFHKWLDLTMLVVTGGRERTEGEYRALYEAAGFRLTRIIPTASEMSVIEGVRA